MFENKLNMKKKGFTLAEVLITIAIVGVVAAMSLPVIKQAYFNHITEIRLKNFYANFNNAMRMSQIENGDIEGWTWESGSTKAEAFEKSIKKYIAPYMKISNIEKRSSTDIVFVLPNGSAFGFFFSIADLVFYPMNYKKTLKNGRRFGENCFYFTLSPSKYKGIVPYIFGWDGQYKTLFTNKDYGCQKFVNYSRAYCTAVIWKNNWKVTKDYPFKIKY